MLVTIDLNNVNDKLIISNNLEEYMRENLPNSHNNPEAKIYIYKSLLLLTEYSKCESKNINYENWLANNKEQPFLSPEKEEELIYRIKNNEYKMLININELKKIIHDNSENIEKLKEIKEVYIYLNYPNIFYDIIEQIDNLILNK